MAGSSRAPGGRPPSPDRARVLYVIQQRDYSGAEIMHVPLMCADPDALLACPPGTRTEELARREGIPTIALPFRTLRHSGGTLETMRSVLRGLLSALDLARLLRAHPERQVLYCITLRSGMLAALAKAGLSRRAVWFVSDFLPPPPVRLGTRVLARLGCDRAIATSKSVARDFAGRSGRLHDRTTVVYPGTKVERFDPRRARPGQPRAAIVGQVSPTKRTDLAIEVAARVLRDVPEFELEILGRAQYRESDFAFERELRNRVEGDASLRRHVRFAGYTSDIAAELSRFGLLLHCRPDEPFGIVLIEAMAAGLPVVAPDAAGPAEVVEHGVTGLLYPPGDADRAAAHVVRLVRDGAQAKRMGAAAHDVVRRRFSGDRQIDDMRRVLDEISRRGDARRR
jgi:glycosyltransferase involved in cell wall biosynthesis